MVKWADLELAVTHPNVYCGGEKVSELCVHVCLSGGFLFGPAAGRVASISDQSARSIVVER